MQGARFFLRRQCLEPLEVLPRAAPLLGRHLLPLLIALEHALTLLGRHRLPALEIALRDRALVRREALHPFDGRRLAEGHLECAAREQRSGRQHEREPAHRRAHFSPPSGCGAVVAGGRAVRAGVAAAGGSSSRSSSSMRSRSATF